MTVQRPSLDRSELAGLLTEAAQSVSSVLTSEYPTAASRSYLHPVLGALSAGPRVVCELSDRLEQFVLDEPLPTTPAGLFTLASYASALGWLTESLAELTAAIDEICTRVGIPAEPPQPAHSDNPAPDGGEIDFTFSELELAAIRSAASAASLTTGEYVDVLSQSLLAAARISDACMEIAGGLLEDAAHVLDAASDEVDTGVGPSGLPTLVRSLLVRMEAGK